MLTRDSIPIAVQTISGMRFMPCLSASYPNTRPRCRSTSYELALHRYDRGIVTDFFPLQLLLATFAGWVNRDQAQVIDYLVEENRVLKEQLGKRRLRLTDDQRRRLAAKGKLLGRRVLSRVATIVTPDTILRWHHRLIKMKWTYSSKRVGRPGIMKLIRQLIVRMASDNASWGYCRTQEARSPRRSVNHRQDAQGPWHRTESSACDIVAHFPPGAR